MYLSHLASDDIHATGDGTELRRVVRERRPPLFYAHLRVMFGVWCVVFGVWYLGFGVRVLLSPTPALEESISVQGYFAHM